MNNRSIMTALITSLAWWTSANWCFWYQDWNRDICSEKGLMLETSALHQTSQAKNIPCQPLLIKPIFSFYSPVQKKFETVFLKASLTVLEYLGLLQQSINYFL